jgi:hypothetical protein
MAAVYARRGAQPDAVNVSRYGPSPWGRLSPFTVVGKVPIPGRLGLWELVALERGEFTSDDLADGFATSVEGIWQGLKRIDGHIDEACFVRPRKRRGVVAGHDYGYRLLDYLEARCLVYVPAYLHVLRHQVRDLVERLARRAAHGEVTIVDVSYAPDPFSLDRPLSHARLLVDYLNGALQPYLDAEQRLRARLEALLGIYDDGEPDGLSAAGLVARQRWWRVTAALVEATDGGELDSYLAWAARWERECLIALVVGDAGMIDDVDLLGEVLGGWVRAGVMTGQEATRLGAQAPLARFGIAVSLADR